MRGRVTEAFHRSSIVKFVSFLVLFYLASLLLFKIDDVVTQIAVASHKDDPRQQQTNTSSTVSVCPSFFRWIHRDLQPWAQSGITKSHLEASGRGFSAFRAVIVDGRLHVEYYHACRQPWTMFTIWGLLQFLARYPGMIPDVDMMFDCMHRPTVARGHGRPRRWWAPVFQYSNNQYPGIPIDVPFPDWSFWGWPETNIQPWDEEFRSMKQASETTNWTRKFDHALYWNGNAKFYSDSLENLLHCNDSGKFGVQVHFQEWALGYFAGWNKSKLSNQCKYRYNIYTGERVFSSVSLKYMLACGSVTLIAPYIENYFFSRGLIPTQNYWPISSNNFCKSINFAVEWLNANPSEAEAIGKAGQELMAELSMEKVYDYMYHLINEYSKLQKFKPTVPSTAQVVTEKQILCDADPRSRELLKKSAVSSSLSPPCTLQPEDSSTMASWKQNKRIIVNVEEMRKAFVKQN